MHQSVYGRENVVRICGFQIRGKHGHIYTTGPLEINSESNLYVYGISIFVNKYKYENRGENSASV